MSDKPFIVRTRLGREPLGQLVRQETKLSLKKLTRYYFLVRFDDERIRLPRGTGKNSTDRQNIHAVIEGKWSGMAATLDELDRVIAPFRMYQKIPIVIEGYPIEDAERAAKGETIVPDFVELESGAPIESVDYRQAVLELEHMMNAFASRGKQADVEYHDVVFNVDGIMVHVAPNGQLRLPNGRLGKKPAAANGSYVLDPEDPPFRLRRDGYLWMRVKAKRGSKARTTWKKLWEAS